jgi:hypothetical protein
MIRYCKSSANASNGPAAGGNGMTAEQIVYQVIDALNAANIHYMLLGSFSSNFYGVARSTRDVDFVVQLGSVTPMQLAEKLGPAFRLDPQISFETITATSRFVASHRASAFTVEFFLLSDDPHDMERFSRRCHEVVQGHDAYVASPEDVVITKLRWSKAGNRRKDIDDVRNVIRVQRDALDWGYIERWCDVHGTRSLLDATRGDAIEERPA